MIRDLVELEQVEHGRFAGGFDGSWCQGPGVFGGLVAATMGRCAERTCPGRPLRALSMQLCAPLLPGPFEVHVTRERMGSFVTFVSARIEQDGKPAALAQVTLGSDRQADGDFTHTAPPRYPPVEQLPDLGRPPGVPVFTQHFDLRFAHGVPFFGAERAVTGGYLRTGQPQALDSSVALALLDTWPLAVLPMFPGPRPAASVVIQFVLFPAVAAADAWYAIQVESRRQQGGYSEQTGRVWTPDGDLVGLSHQLVVRLR